MTAVKNHTGGDHHLYVRNFDNDLPSSAPERRTWAGQAARVAKVALPYLSLYQPISKPLTLAMGAVRSLQSAQSLVTAIQSGERLAILRAVVELAVGVASVAGTIFAHPLGMVISTTHDLVLAIAGLVQAIRSGDREAILQASLQVASSALYLALMGFGGMHLMIASTALQIAIGAVQSRHEWARGNFLEALGQLGMVVIRGKQLVGQVQVVIQEKADRKYLIGAMARHGNNAKGLTALQHAVVCRDHRAVKLLLKHGASPFTKPGTPDCLQLAVGVGDLELVKIFIKAGLPVMDFGETDPLHALFRISRSRSHRIPERGWYEIWPSALALSIEIGNDQIFEALLEHWRLHPLQQIQGVDLEQRMYQDLLVTCAEYGRLDFLRAVAIHKGMQPVPIGSALLRAGVCRETPGVGAGFQCFRFFDDFHGVSFSELCSTDDQTPIQLQAKVSEAGKAACVEFLCSQGLAKNHDGNQAVLSLGELSDSWNEAGGFARLEPLKTLVALGRAAPFERLWDGFRWWTHLEGKNSLEFLAVAREENLTSFDFDSMQQGTSAYVCSLARSTKRWETDPVWRTHHEANLVWLHQHGADLLGWCGYSDTQRTISESLLSMGAQNLRDSLASLTKSSSSNCA